MKYDVTIPFIRQVAGPMDYTQGAMRNATRNSYFPCNSEPMSQGTRCHQLALYTILESPFNMLCDNPSNYMREPESLEFISQIPTVWMKPAYWMGKWVNTSLPPVAKAMCGT
jgi:alpha-glucosidase